VSDIYVGPDLEVDETATLQTALDAFASLIPGWKPRTSSHEYGIMAAASRLAVEQRLALIAATDAIWASYGERVLDFPPNPALSATATLVFALTGAAVTPGFVIRAGTTAALTAPDGTVVSFSTDVDVTAAAGATTASANATALTPGVVGNNLSGTCDLDTTVPTQNGVSILSVSITTPSAGGSDKETTDSYNNRLVTRARLQSEVPIQPADFAAIAMLNLAVARALAIDLYDPVANTYGHPDTNTVVLQGYDGGPVATQTLNDVDADLQARREVGWVSNTMQVTVVPLVFAVTVTKRTGAADVDVTAAVNAAVKAWANPLTWGSPDRPTDPAWRIVDKVRLNDLLGAVYKADGVAFVESATIAGSAADFTLDRPYKAPTVNGSVAVTVH
jgi:hypothetical protein